MKRLRKTMIAAGTVLTLIAGAVPANAATMVILAAPETTSESVAETIADAHNISPMPGGSTEAETVRESTGGSEAGAESAAEVEAPAANIPKVEDVMAEAPGSGSSGDAAAEGMSAAEAPGASAETKAPETEAETQAPETEAETKAPETEAETKAPEKETGTLDPGSLVTKYGGSLKAEEIVSAAAQSDYENIAISQVTDYVNVRSDATTAGSIVGKIYNNAAADILETVDGEDGSWYKIRSGKVTGYIKAQYFITGEDAKAKASEVGTSIAKVTSTTQLRLREQPNTDSEILDLLSPNDEYEVIGEEEGFSRIRVDSDLTGYVSNDYIKTIVVFDHAVTLEEEAAKLADEARRKEEADAAIAAMNEARASEEAEGGAGETEGGETAPGAEAAPGGGSEASRDGSAAGPGGGSPEGGSASVSGTSSSGEMTGPGGGTLSGPGGGSKKSSKVETATRSAIVAYAKQFLGNPYVYGGTSLTNGTDCSGFTQGVYAHFGIATGRTSRDQAAKGREISVQSAQPGDLLFYASGSYINHVAMYIGDGQIIHASTAKTGIKISPYDYRTPCKAVTFLD